MSGTAAPKKQDLLRQQKIDHDGPGTILRDFQSLLEFIGKVGVRATGKYHLLPLDCLQELDERMSRPYRPSLIRPQLRSFPHLHGLYLLLRSTGLGVTEGSGRKTGRLSLHPQLLEQWEQLNATEQYFNLLEAWLLHASFEITQDRGRTCLDDLRFLLPGLNIRTNHPDASGFFVLNYFGNETDCTLALMELFGLVEVAARLPELQSHMRAKVRRTPFGIQLFAALFADVERLWKAIDNGPDFGVWQSVLQKDFPEWQHNLEISGPEFQEGIYEFKVSWGKTWRRIALPAESDLDELAQAIIEAYDFDGDHLYEFRLRDERGRNLAVTAPDTDDAEIYTDEFSIGCLPLAKGESLEFIYGFGAYWQFQVKLERIGPPNKKVRKAKITESHLESPPEYDDEEDDW